MTRSRVAIVLVIVALALAMAAVWMAFDNPDVDNASRGDDDFTCAAPFDTVLNDDAANFPGETPPNEEVAARCWEAGQDRFKLAFACSVAAVIGVLAALAIV